MVTKEQLDTYNIVTKWLALYDMYPKLKSTYEYTKRKKTQT